MWAETFRTFDYRDLMKDLDYMKASFRNQPECGDGSAGEDFTIIHSVILDGPNAPFSYQPFGAIGSNSEFMRIMAGLGTYRFLVVADAPFLDN